MNNQLALTTKHYNDIQNEIKRERTLLSLIIKQFSEAQIYTGISNEELQQWQMASDRKTNLAAEDAIVSEKLRMLQKEQSYLQIFRPPKKRKRERLTSEIVESVKHRKRK